LAEINNDEEPKKVDKREEKELIEAKTKFT